MRIVVRVTIVFAALAIAGCSPAVERADDSAASTTISTGDSTTGRVAAGYSRFAIGLWPGEGVPVFSAARPMLLLRASPDSAATVIDTLRAAIGASLQFDSTHVETVQSGVIRVLDHIRVSGRDFGAITFLSRERYNSGASRDTVIELSPPAVIELLQHRAEGTCFVRINAHVIDANPCPMLDKETTVLERTPVVLWWVRVQGPTHAGWIVIDESTARIVKRSVP
ncbi:MAG: hypothetical protein ABIW79_11155 [Gemmatimonas sp.]